MPAIDEIATIRPAGRAIWPSSASVGSTVVITLPS